MKKLYRIILLPAALLALSASLQCEARLPRLEIRVANFPVLAELALTSEDRERGLMYRNSLGAEEGMLFVFPEAHFQSFWMKNTLIPLDVGFFDSDGFLIEYRSMIPNNDTITYNSSEPALYALEMNKGWFEKKGLKKYAKLILPRPVRGL